jgi:type I restriction enzyme S subunit
LEFRYEETRNITGSYDRSGLNLKLIRDIKIPRPRLAEQQKIAGILLAVDFSLQKTDEIIAKTQRLKKGLMQQLLTKGIGHTKLKQAEIGLIPKEWDVVSYSEVTHRITYGFTNPMPHVEDGLYIITAKNIKDGMIDYQSAKRTSKEAFEQLLTDKSRPRRGDVLLTKDGTIGRSAVADQDSICINQSVALLRPRSDKILPEFLHWSLQSPSIQERIRADSSKTTIHHIAITKLACMRFGLPSIPEQKEIVEIVEAAQSRLTNEIAAYDRLLLLKKSLMQVLLTGKVRVKVD